jgi:hypothetical protein
VQPVCFKVAFVTDQKKIILLNIEDFG